LRCLTVIVLGTSTLLDQPVVRVLPVRIDTWSLTSLQQRLVKTGGRLVKHARYYWLLLTESHLTRRLFGSMLQRIWALPVPTGCRARVTGGRVRREDGRRAKCP
jgi:hypothetical protein